MYACKKYMLNEKSIIPESIFTMLVIFSDTRAIITIIISPILYKLIIEIYVYYI